MKLDFLHLGGAGAALPKRLIARRMRQLDIQPLDRADRTIRMGVIAALLFVALLVTFALVAPISSAAIAPATVSVAGDTFNVQPTGTGIVTQVLVREGQAVRQGQPLVRMNGVRSGAQLRQAQARHDALRALEARLVAERDQAPALAFPPELLRRRDDPATAKAMTTQAAIFAQRQAVLASDRATADQSVLAARAREAASSRQLLLVADELGDYRSLYARGFARKTTIRALERTEAQLRADSLGGLASVRQAELAARRVRDSQRLELETQLGQVQEQLAQVSPQLDISRYQADQDQLRAPAAGRVSGIVEMGPGMVVSGGRTLMRLVPNGRPMIVEARVKPEDIDDVRIGQPATVRFSTVNPHGKTAFAGHVVTLSPAEVQGEGGAYFKAQVALDDPVGARRDGLTLQPGIPASVTIKTANRTLAEYLLSPSSDAVSRSFREE